jgi:tRNA modification GTPase
VADRRLNAVATVLTPPGTAGVATIAVVGRDAWKVVAPLFRRPRGQPLAAAPDPGTIHFGTFGPPPGDEVVLASRPDQESPWYEIHCHGGMQVVEWVLEQVMKNGATITSWKKLISPEPATLRTIALRNLTKAMTLRAANVLLDQSLGAFDRAIRRITELFDQSRVNAASDGLNRLLRWAPLGRHLTTPWRVAICGPPNVGKSSLVNALAGFRRAVVTPTPGTTRDVVTTLIALDGWPVELLDTAGVRVTTEELEGEGIRRGEAAARAADLVVWVMDRSTSPQPPPKDLEPLLVINKADLPSLWDAPSFGPAPLVSATTGDGIGAFAEAIVGRLIPTPPMPGEAVPFNDGLVQELTEIHDDIVASRTARARARLTSLLSPAQSA